jgi:hypothetical protein
MDKKATSFEDHQGGQVELSVSFSESLPDPPAVFMKFLTHLMNKYP